MEDALRRDLTVNALFYRLGRQPGEDGVVEDFTGKGLGDLESALARTPLDPMATFMDDPLRMLRAARFAARFSLRVSPDIPGATRSEPVRTALAVKVSRERVGAEMVGILEGPAPLRGLRLLLSFGLFREITMIEQAGLEGASDAAVQRAHAVFALLADPLRLPRASLPAFMLSAFLCPVRDQVVTDKKGKTSPLVRTIVLTNLKLSIAEADQVTLLATMADGTLELAARAAAGSASRLELGNWVRTAGAGWRAVCAFAAVVARTHPDLAPLGAADDDVIGNPATAACALDAAVVATVRAMADRIEGEGLGEAFALKPMLNGSEIAELRGVKGGPEVGVITARLIQAQLHNPTLTRQDAELIARGQL